MLFSGYPVDKTKTIRTAFDNDHQSLKAFQLVNVIVR